MAISYLIFGFLLNAHITIKHEELFKQACKNIRGKPFSFEVLKSLDGFCYDHSVKYAMRKCNEGDIGHYLTTLASSL